MLNLQEPALVLNKGWCPVGVTTVREALCKLYVGTALVVAMDDYSLHDFESWSSRPLRLGVPLVRTPQLAFPLPEVIVLASFDRVPLIRLGFSREQVFKRDGCRCQYCGKVVRRDQITLDHVVPRSRGGRSAWTNCVSACAPCNSHKGNRTPEEAGMRLMQSPRKPVGTPEMLVHRCRRPKKSWSHFVRVG